MVAAVTSLARLERSSFGCDVGFDLLCGGVERECGDGVVAGVPAAERQEVVAGVEQDAVLCGFDLAHGLEDAAAAGVDGADNLCGRAGVDFGGVDVGVSGVSDDACGCGVVAESGDACVGAFGDSGHVGVECDVCEVWPSLARWSANDKAVCERALATKPRRGGRVGQHAVDLQLDCGDAARVDLETPGHMVRETGVGGSRSTARTCRRCCRRSIGRQRRRRHSGFR